MMTVAETMSTRRIHGREHYGSEKAAAGGARRGSARRSVCLAVLALRGAIRPNVSLAAASVVARRCAHGARLVGHHDGGTGNRRQRSPAAGRLPRGSEKTY